MNKRGVRLTKDLYGVLLERKDEVVRLAEKLLPYTPASHWEKIAWMKFVLEVKDEKYWVSVKGWGDGSKRGN